MAEDKLEIVKYTDSVSPNDKSCSFCGNIITKGEKFTKLTLRISGYQRIEPLVFHRLPDQCTKSDNGVQQTSKSLIRLRKNHYANYWSTDEIIFDKNKTKQLFDNGYELIAVSKSKDLAISSASQYRESGKVTLISFIDEWYEVWTKSVK